MSRRRGRRGAGGEALRRRQAVREAERLAPIPPKLRRPRFHVERASGGRFYPPERSPR